MLGSSVAVSGLLQLRPPRKSMDPFTPTKEALTTLHPIVKGRSKQISDCGSASKCPGDRLASLVLICLPDSKHFRQSQIRQQQRQLKSRIYCQIVKYSGGQRSGLSTFQLPEANHKQPDGELSAGFASRSPKIYESRPSFVTAPLVGYRGTHQTHYPNRRWREHTCCQQQPRLIPHPSRSLALT